jgi:hypothetical protein
MIISTHAMDLHGTERPADVVDDIYVRGRGLKDESMGLVGRKLFRSTHLLQPKELGGLHQSFQL